VEPASASAGAGGELKGGVADLQVFET